MSLIDLFDNLFKIKENAQLKRRIKELEAQLSPGVKIYSPAHKKWHGKAPQYKGRGKALQHKGHGKTQQYKGHGKTPQHKGQDYGTPKGQSKQEKKLRETIGRLQAQADDLTRRIEIAKRELVETDDTVLLQSVGLYKPRFVFANSEGYKEKLNAIRRRQKEMIRADTAVRGAIGWTVNGDARKGAKLVNDTKKLLLRAFNNECDDIVEHVRFSNVEASEKRMRTACTTISKLGTMMSIEVTHRYLQAKVDELYLAYEYQLKKQEEKEEQKRIRAELREQEKLAREIEESRRELEKEQNHYKNVLSKLEQQMSSARGDALSLLEEKKKEIITQLHKIDASMQQVDYRAANQKAGYVYIISNIGAFGENVYKIGMTRRLEPMDRIDELGDASVPFDFDVHAMIFSDNAPALEAALHHAFEDRKINMVNTRREFFRVTLDEIERVVRANYDKTVEFARIPEAQQYRQSLAMQRSGNNGNAV